jgi:hypothetical protein
VKREPLCEREWRVVRKVKFECNLVSNDTTSALYYG